MSLELDIILTALTQKLQNRGVSINKIGADYTPTTIGDHLLAPLHGFCTNVELAAILLHYTMTCKPEYKTELQRLRPRPRTLSAIEQNLELPTNTLAAMYPPTFQELLKFVDATAPALLAFEQSKQYVSDGCSSKGRWRSRMVWDGALDCVRDRVFFLFLVFFPQMLLRRVCCVRACVRAGSTTRVIRTCGHRGKHDSLQYYFATSNLLPAHSSTVSACPSPAHAGCSFILPHPNRQHRFRGVEAEQDVP